MSDWPHALVHRVLEKSTYIITASTYQKISYFHTPERLQFLHDTLLQLAQSYEWNMQTWAVLSNHYHFIAQSPQNPGNQATFLSHLHVMTAKYVNTQDQISNRRVWWQY